MEELDEMFPHRLISRFLELNWPPRSPDFSAPDYFLLWLSEESRIGHAARNFG
jgi:hypothetical protein